MGQFAKMPGPTARLARIGTRIEQSAVELPDRISAAAERAMLPLIDKGYKSRTSPYGTPWPKPVDGGKPMERPSAKLRKSYAVVRLIHRMRWTIWVSNNARSKKGAYYGAILQAGFRHWRSGAFIVARKQVPDAGQIAPRWASRLQEVGWREGQLWAQRMAAR